MVATVSSQITDEKVIDPRRELPIVWLNGCIKLPHKYLSYLNVALWFGQNITISSKWSWMHRLRHVTGQNIENKICHALNEISVSVKYREYCRRWEQKIITVGC